MNIYSVYEQTSSKVPYQVLYGKYKNHIDYKNKTKLLPFNLKNEAQSLVIDSFVYCILVKFMFAKGGAAMYNAALIN
ncbi:hypothetical protein A6E05_10260 [Aliivibrio sp. 1S165]|nr:hypothetical protein A6E05_10260 [Aliivibrio sp. 1S165]OCH35872.1 hypothetical protein A6E06_10990 [Aliivibrio sp. 1S175]